MNEPFDRSKLSVAQELRLISKAIRKYQTPQHPAVKDLLRIADEVENLTERAAQPKTAAAQERLQNPD